MDFRQEFIEFALAQNVLRFGEFKTKAGRLSPYFFNAGLFNDGAALDRLSQFYAKAILANGLEIDMLFGPAYKGIPLVAVSALALAQAGRNLPFAFNRKEVKDHGDTGILLGSKLKDGDRVVMIEDVTTSGKSIEETFPIIKAQADVEIKGLMVSLNRMERGLSSDKSALHEIKEKYGIDARAIVNMDEVVEHLYNRPCQGQVVIDDEIKKAIDAYYKEYGAR